MQSKLLRALQERAVMSVGGTEEIPVDARLIGVAAGALAAVRRAPMVVVVMVAMAATALLRLVA